MAIKPFTPVGKIFIQLINNDEWWVVTQMTFHPDPICDSTNVIALNTIYKPDASNPCSKHCLKGKWNIYKN